MKTQQELKYLLKAFEETSSEAERKEFLDDLTHEDRQAFRRIKKEKAALEKELAETRKALDRHFEQLPSSKNKGEIGKRYSELSELYRKRGDRKSADELARLLTRLNDLEKKKRDWLK